MDNIYSAPNADLSAVAESDAFYTPTMFSISGRIGRMRGIAYPMGAGLVLMLAISVIAGLSVAFNSTVLGLLVIALYLPAVAIHFIFMIRRLNDLNCSGWLSLLSFVPLVNLFFILYLWFAPGTPGPNNYGLPPGPNTTLVKIGALLMPLIFIGGILAAIAIPAYQGYLIKAKAAQGQRQ